MLALALLLAVQVPPEEPPLREGYVMLPIFSEMPTTREHAAAQPRDAAGALLGGFALIECTVTAAGPLKDCGVASERPVGRGFGAAALALARRYVLSPGETEGLRVEIPFLWRDPNEPIPTE